MIPTNFHGKLHSTDACLIVTVQKDITGTRVGTKHEPKLWVLRRMVRREAWYIRRVCSVLWSGCSILVILARASEAVGGDDIGGETLFFVAD
jgi:hypothetical protein